jgi:sarcosine oxidase subunit delta
MKLMTCPLNGPRNIAEFQCLGAVKAMPDPASCTDKEWTDYVWHAENRRGAVREWWCHLPTSYFFIAERDTATDEIVRTYPPSGPVEP